MTCHVQCSTFDPPLVRVTLAVLLLWDLAHPEENTLGHLGHPGMLVVKNSFHGGSARCAFTTESIGSTAFVVGKLGLA
eukprot:SAG22_NODE_6238_length_882_cov_0.878672_2_plen_78_part_00